MEKYDVEFLRKQDSIRMSGLPLMFSGWNNVFKRVEGEDSEGCPVYHLDEYALYFIIPILAVTIKKKDGKWIFYRDCDTDNFAFMKKVAGQSEETPFGEWTYGGCVTPINKNDSRHQPFWFGMGMGLLIGIVATALAIKI